MSKALALLALTVLSSVYAAEVPQPSWTNHNRIAGSQQMMTNFKPWAEAVESTLGDKRDEDDLNVYFRAFTGRENWTLRRNSEEYELEYVSEGYWKHDYTEPGLYDYIRIRNGTNFEYGENVGTGESAMWYDDYNQLQEHPEYIDMSGIRTYVSRTPQGSMTPTSDRLATTNGVNKSIAANNVGYRVRESVAWSGAAELAMNANGVRSADETRSGAMLFDQIDGKATKTELADRYTIKSETFTNGVSAVVTNDVERWDISGTPKAQSYYWLYFDQNLPTIAFLMDGNENISECRYAQGVKTLHFTLSYSSDPIDITARLITENALGLAYSKDIPAISATDPTFSNAVLSVQISTNEFAALYELKNAFAELPIDPVTGGISIGSLLAALASAVVWLKKNKVQTLKLEDNSVETSADGGVAKLDDFFTESNSLLTGTIDDRLPIPISAKSAGFTTESYKRFVVTVSGDMTVTLHTPTSEDAEIFECRFNGTSLSADASITFAGATATTMDTDCGTVTAGKVALMSAFWNGATWDVNWKVGG